MRRRIIAPVAALALAGLVAGASPAAAVTRTFTVIMTGDQEVPNPGDPDGFGIGRVTVDTDTNRICYVVRVTGVQLPISAAHIHLAPAGSPGGVVVPLPAPGRGRSGCVTDSDADAIVANPANYYLNVHNAPYPGGALRGQLA